MKFGEKLRELRRKNALTQGELAKKSGLSLRTISNYEAGSSYPKDRGVYALLAEILGTKESYLISEDEEFFLQAGAEFGANGQAGAVKILEQANALFAGGQLNEDEKLAFVTEIQKLYLDSKKRAKKFAPKNKD